MRETYTPDQIFIKRLTEITETNLTNENFGVRELAHESGMSLYRLNRRLHSITKKTCNQFIREIRLQKAFEMLQNEAYTVAEIAFKTGFRSPNYFNKCFHEYFGYSPGKVKNADSNNQEFYDLDLGVVNRRKRNNSWRDYILTLPGIAVLVMLTIIIGIILLKTTNKSDWSEELRSSDGRISLAVMPFRNMTKDSTLNIWQEGIQTSFISFLTNSEELTIKTSVNEYIQSKGLTDYASLTPTIENLIAKKINARLFISGSIINSGSKIIINAQIFDSNKKEAIRSFEKEGNPGGDKIYELIDTLRHQVNNFLIVTKIKKKDPNSVLYFLDPISSPEAFKCMVAAKKAERNSDFTTAINLYKQAIKIDSSIYDAYWAIAIDYGEQGDLANCKSWLLRYYSNYDKLNMYNKAYADYLYAIIFKTPNEALKYVEMMINLSDNVPYNFVNLGDEYNKLFQYDKAIPEYEKALEIYKKWDTKPPASIIYTELGKAYHNSGRYREEKKLYMKAEHDFPDNPVIIARQAILSLACRDSVAANQYIRKYILLRRNNSWSEAKIMNGLAVIYSRGGNHNKAEEYYRFAHLKEPENSTWINNLGFFLIDENRNVEEGLSLIDKALYTNPDDYSLLDSKGWGLYKQGKYQEALELMKRSWDLRLKYTSYDHASYLRLVEVKKAAAGQTWKKV
jgi:AraC-like DNA-binding protein/Tfp pilus assembly protein PilF/TolB-like protein